MSEILTVIVPFYCTPKELFKGCMSSVLENKLTNIEVLVIDDGSPEDKRKCLNDYAQDKRVKVIYMNHAGVSEARNKGIKEAHGKYITFIDSDDYVRRETFTYIVDNLLKYNGDIELFNGGLDKNGEIIKNTSFLCENYDYAKKREDKIAIMESALTVGFLPTGYRQLFSLGSPCCKLFKKSFLTKNALLFDRNVKFAEDTLFLLNAYQAAESIFYNEIYLYSYVYNNQSVTRRFRPGLSADMDVFFDRIRGFIERNDLWKELEKAYYLRAEFEVGRSFNLEFFHPLNSEKKATSRYIAFVSKEPYKSALRNRYLPRKNIKQKIYAFLVRNKMGNMYRFLNRFKNKRCNNGTSRINNLP